MATFTPGPWRHDDIGEDFQYVTGPGEDQTKGNVATCWSAGTDARANARLVASAPDLLEALEQAVAELHSVHADYGDKDNAREHSAGIRMGEAAIARARGEG